MKKIKKTYLKTSHIQYDLVVKLFKPHQYKKKRNTIGLVILISVK